LITVGEPLPTDGPGERLLRTGILADMLSRRGHDVLWWTSSFDHFAKHQRHGTDVLQVVEDRYRIHQLHANGYRKNVSLTRLLNHYGLARKFRKHSVLEPRPEIILSSLPTLELCVEATRYGRKRGIPVVLDVRDLWPDIFLELVPRWGRSASRIVLSPLFQAAREACRDATAILGITPEIVAWGLKYAERAPSEWDRDFPLGYSQVPPPEGETEQAAERWRTRGVGAEDFNLCFFGTIGRQFDLETVIDAAWRLKEGDRPFRFVICGSGDKLEFYRKKASGCPNVLFPGWVNRADILALMQMSAAGLAPYRNKPDFLLSLPNKPLEYLSAGLPVVSSLKGTLKRLLEEHHCGMTYGEGDPDSLVATLVFLHDHREASYEMSRNARELFAGRFDAEKVYGELIGHLERIEEASRTPGRSGATVA